MRGKRWPVSVLSFMLLGFALSCGVAGAQEAPFPSYGEGAVEARIYTDYFCTPCRAMEAEIEPLLEALLKKGGVRLVFVDTPVHRHTPLFARYFLYALKAKNDFDHALQVRRVLFEAAGRNVTDETKLKTALIEKGVEMQAFDLAPAVRRYNEMIKADHISGTPTCVIVRHNGKKETVVGGKDIVQALKTLQK